MLRRIPVCMHRANMAATTFLDTVWNRVGVAGEASDAVSPYTQVHRTEPPRLLRPPEDCPFGTRLPPRQRQVGTAQRTPRFLWNQFMCPLAGLLCGNSVKIFYEGRMGGNIMGMSPSCTKSSGCSCRSTWTIYRAGMISVTRVCGHACTTCVRSFVSFKPFVSLCDCSAPASC